MPSFPAVTRAAPVAAERAFASDRKSNGAAEAAGAAGGSVEDLFAKLLGGLDTGKDATSKLARSEASTGEDTKAGETAASALAGLAIVVTPTPTVPPTGIAPVISGAQPDGAATEDAEAKTGSAPAPSGANIGEGDAQTGSALPPGATAQPVVAGQNAAEGEPIVDPTTAGATAKPVVEPSRSMATATAPATAQGAPGLVMEIAAISAAHAATDAITSALGVSANTPANGAQAALAQAAQPRVAGAPRVATGPAGAETAKAGALAGIGSVSGGAAAFEGSGLDGFVAVSQIASDTADMTGQALANPLATVPGQRPAHPASPLMAAALGFAERLKADAEALEAEIDALGGPLAAASGRVDTASTAQATQPSPGLGREAAVPLPMLASEIARQVERGKKSFDIRLDPPELGKVRVKLDLGQEGEVRAHLIVERKETLDQLQRDQRVLERALQTAGLDLTGGGLQFSLSGGGQQRSSGEGSPGSPRRADARGSEAVAETPLAPPPPRLGARPGGIDVRI